jgi:hypothetical protein
MVWLDGEARYARAPDYPWGRTAEELEAELVDLRSWGTEEYGPMLAEDQAEAGNVIPESDIPVFSKASRNACTPDVAIELARMWAETDVREVLPAIQVPTLVGALSLLGQVERAKDIASRIPGAEFLEVPDGGFAQQTTARYVEAIRRFAGATHAPVDLDTVLATVLFTDIVGSTQRQAELDDRGWQDRSRATTRSSARRSTGGTERSSTPPATASTRPSRDPPARSDVPTMSSMGSGRWGSRFEPECMQESAG